jgi:glycosyltransferase involved in cell wall biosynthesis
MTLLPFSGWLRPLRELSYYYYLSAQFQRIAHFIDALEPDVVIVHPSMTFQASPLLFFLKTPTIYIAEEWPRVVYEPLLHPLPTGRIQGIYEHLRRLWLGRLDREAARAATAIVATSSYMQSCLRSIYDKDIQLIPLGVDTTLFCPAAVAKGEYFLFVGNKEAINGYDLVSEMEQVFGKVCPIKYVSFEQGEFSHPDAHLIKLYQRARGTLCLADHEPFGLVALESQSCGTPVIALKEGGYLDTVAHRRTGIMIPRSIKALREAILLLICDDDLYSKMSLYGREKMIRSYDWKQHILHIERLITKVVRHD